MTLALMQQDDQGEDSILAQDQSFHNVLRHCLYDHILLTLAQKSHNLFYEICISLPHHLQLPFSLDKSLDKYFSNVKMGNPFFSVNTLMFNLFFLKGVPFSSTQSPVPLSQSDTAFFIFSWSFLAQFTLLFCQVN